MKNYFVVIIHIFLFLSLSCCHNQLGSTINNIDVSSNHSEYSIDWTLEYSIDWTKYPTINIDSQPLKPFSKKTVIQSSDFPERKSNAIRFDNYFLWYQVAMDTTYCIDLDGNQFLWKKQGVSIQPYSQEDSLKQNLLLCASKQSIQDKEIISVVALDVTNGKKVWEYTKPEWSRLNKNPPEITPSINQITKKTIILSSRNPDYYFLIGIDLLTGKELWQYTSPLSYNWKLVYMDKMIICKETTGNLIALDHDSGDMLWKNCAITLAENPENWLPERYYFAKVTDQTAFFCQTMPDQDKFSAHLIDLTSGKIVKSGIQFLDAMKEISIEDVLTCSDDFQGYMIMSIQNQYYLFKINLNEMKEEWRLSLGEWELKEASGYCTLFLESSLPDTVYLSWSGNLYEGNDESTIMPNKLHDGFYEIDASKGKILWWNRLGYFLDDGILYFGESSCLNGFNQEKRGYLDIKTKKVISAYTLSSQFTINKEDSIEPSSYVYRISGSQSGEKYAYLEINKFTGEIIAYYPDLGKDKIDNFAVYENIRFFHVKEKNEFVMVK